METAVVKIAVYAIPEKPYVYVLKQKSKENGIYDKIKFNGYLNKMKSEFDISIDVKTNKQIHDRFIIFEKTCWSIGSSIKDLGNKDTVISEVTEVINSLKDLFNKRWTEVQTILVIMIVFF